MNIAYTRPKDEQPIELSHEILAYTHVLESEKQMWAAVLHQAVKDAKDLFKTAMRNPQATARTDFQHDVRSLQDYFLFPSMQPGGLGFICAWLDIDPEEFSNRVMAKYLNPLLQDFNYSAPQKHSRIQ